MSRISQIVLYFKEWFRFEKMTYWLILTYLGHWRKTSGLLFSWKGFFFFFYAFSYKEYEVELVMFVVMCIDNK